MMDDENRIDAIASGIYKFLHRPENMHLLKQVQAAPPWFPFCPCNVDDYDNCTCQHFYGYLFGLESVISDAMDAQNWLRDKDHLYFFGLGLVTVAHTIRESL
jgi:hypothetical protein